MDGAVDFADEEVEVGDLVAFVGGGLFHEFEELLVAELPYSGGPGEVGDAEGAEGFIYYVEVAVFEHLEPEVEIDGVGDCGAVAGGFCNELRRVEAADRLADDVGAHADHFAGNFYHAFTASIDKVHFFNEGFTFGIDYGPLAAYEADSPVERIMKCCNLFFETLGEENVVTANELDVFAPDPADGLVPVPFGAEVAGISEKFYARVGK